MATKLAPPPVRTALPDDPVAPPTQTQPRRQDAGGWFTRVRRLVKLALDGDDEMVSVENATSVSWHIYHKYHLLGILDAGETRQFRLRKSGNLNARPSLQSDESEYLVVELDTHIQRVKIYRRQMGQSVEVYDMRAA